MAQTPAPLGNDGAFYGMTDNGGANQNGVIYKINSTGALTPLFSFGGTNGSSPISTLIYGNDGHFYGTTSKGGLHGQGTIFRY